MALSFRINVPDCQGQRGFTLLEVMLATFITGFVFAGVLSAYIFLGRGLTRQGNEAQMDSATRVTLTNLSNDVSTATSIDPANMTATTLGLLYTPASSTKVIYIYNASTGTLQRQVVGVTTTTMTLMSNLTSCSFNYYSFGYDLTAGPPTPPTAIGVKQVNVTFSCQAGLAVTGAQANLTIASPRITLKDKVLLGDNPGVP